MYCIEERHAPSLRAVRDRVARHCPSRHAPRSKRLAAQLTALGRLFGVVKYFHAAFLERDVPWDSAVAVAVETVSAATSTDEYGSATRLRRPAASPLVTSSCEWMAKRPPRGRSKRCSLRRDRVVESSASIYRAAASSPSTRTMTSPTARPLAFAAESPSHIRRYSSRHSRFRRPPPPPNPKVHRAREMPHESTSPRQRADRAP